MSDKEASFEVRERRRFVDSTTDEPEKPGAAQNDDPAKDPAPTQDASSSVSEPPHPDPSQPTVEPAPEARSEADDSAENASGDGEEGLMPEITTIGVLHFATGALSQLAWQHLGLMPSQTTGKVEANIPEARLAIDALAALAPVMNSRMNETNRRELQNLLTNLRLNYVEQSKRQGTGGQE